MTSSVRRRLRYWLWCPPCIYFVLGPVMPCGAQATAGSILGRVTDASQAVVPFALVRAQNDATGLAQAIRTNSSGEYDLGPLPPGAYTLTVTRERFAPAVHAGLQLRIDQKMRVDVQLSVDPVSQLEVVTVQAPMLQTESAETGAVLELREIRDLPLLARNFLDLARLTSGVARGSGGNTLNLAVNGQREFANSVLVDGIEVSSNRNNDTANRPGLDSVEEFKVLTSSYPAEFGRAAGAIVAIQTTSGTNRFHGGLYEFFRPSATAASSFFATESSPLKQHNYGGTAGGPLRRDKTFFFFSYEGTRLRNAFSYLDSVPPAGQIRFPAGGADLSGLLDPATGKQIPIFDPNAYAVNFVAEPFPGNIIPAGRLSSPGKAILQNFFPAPNRPGILQGWFGNFAARQAYLYDADTFDGRIDHIFSERDRLSGTYHYGSFLSVTGDRFAGQIPVAGGGDADTGDHEDSRGQTLSVAGIHVLSNTAINELRFGYTRFRLDQLSLLDRRQVANQFGLGNINLAGYPQTAGFPYVYLGFGAQTGGSTFKPLFFRDSNYQLADSVTWHRGKHDVKAGLQYRRLSSNPFFSLFPAGFQYYGGPGSSLTADPNYAFFDSQAFYSNGGSDIADLLLGLPYSVNLGLQLTNPVTRSWEGSFYGQDTWQIRPGLALSFGLRYEYLSPWTEVDNRASNLDPSTRQILLAGRGGNSAALIQPDRNNFAPRFGMAYRITPRTVLRAGWGIFYSPENDAREDVLTKNYPFATRQNVFNDIFGGLPFPYMLATGVTRTIPAPVEESVASIDPAAVKKATGTAQNIFLIDANLRTGYSQVYNLTLQREITPRCTVEAGWVGALSRKLPYAVGNINLAGAVTSALGQVQALYAEGSSNYQSLQIKGVRRFARGQSVLIAYTFGKSIDNGPAPFNLGSNLNSHNQPQDPFHLAPERAVADSDVKQNLISGYVLELPFGKGQRFLTDLGGWRQALLGGWQINGIAAARSGLPLNVVRNPQDAGYEGLRPDVLRDPNLPGAERTLTRYFDTSAFSKSRFTGARKHTPGDAGRNLVRGPGLVNLDFSTFKEFHLRERTRLQVRFEFFNLTNTPHFANPAGSLSDGAFGSITHTVANPRVVQFAAKLGW